MGGGLSLSIGMEKMKTAALLLGLICALSLGILAMAGSAGTETGEFCPTCPDWTNLDGWLAQRDAYERAQMNEQNSQQSTGVARPAAGHSAPKSRGKLCPARSHHHAGETG